jgi:hypothetical protein
VHGSKAAASFDAASMMANDASLVMLSCMAVVERRAEAEVGPVDAGKGYMHVGLPRTPLK